MAKTSKTYTIEEETMKIVKLNKEGRKLSSDSASLERIVLEWNILKNIKEGSYNIDIDKIVEKVIEKININKLKCNAESAVDKDNKTDFDRSITVAIEDIPD